MSDTDLRWYVAHTAPGEEVDANRRLKRQGYMTFYPFERIEKMRPVPGQRGKRRRETIERPLFSRYIFVSINPRKPRQNLYEVNNTPGVSTVLYMGLEPLEVPMAVMEELFDRANDEGCVGRKDEVSRVRFNPGDVVRAKPGTVFDEWIKNVVVGVDNGEAVELFVDMFGSQRRIVVSPELVEKIA